MKNVAIALWFTWNVMVAGHLFREVWIIATHGMDALPKCRRWWCPEGIRNRWKS